MKMNTWYKIDENGNKTPVHFKSTAEIVADYIIKGAETLNKKCTKYMNSGKADEHAKMIGRIGGNVTRAAGNALIATAKDGIQLIEAGVIATGGIIAKDKDTIKMGGKIACQVGKRRVKRIANGVKSIVKTGHYYYVNWDKLSNESKKKLYEYGITTVLGVFLTAAMYHEIGLHSSEVNPVECIYPMVDIDELPYIHNGVFDSDNDYALQQLISLGEIDNTTHYPDIERNMTAVNDFLNMHRISEHDGYEVHHIIPLSEGGADVPENMVLIRSDLHHQITAAHDAFYGWHS